MQFRKKPTTVDAVQWTGGNTTEVADFMGNSSAFESTTADGHRVRLTTIHGETAYARVGDWIIAEPEPGRFYPCKPDIFAATYDHVVELDEDVIQRAVDQATANPGQTVHVGEHGPEITWSER